MRQESRQLRFSAQAKELRQMTEEEYPELLRYLRRQVEKIGRPDLDHIAFSAMEFAERPSDAFMAYAGSLLDQIQLESHEGVIAATQKLSRPLELTEGGDVEDIMLVPSNLGRTAVDMDTLSLRSILPSRAEFLRDLAQIVRELEIERNRPV